MRRRRYSEDIRGKTQGYNGAQREGLERKREQVSLELRIRRRGRMDQRGDWKEGTVAYVSGNDFPCGMDFSPKFGQVHIGILYSEDVELSRGRLDKKM